MINKKVSSYVSPGKYSTFSDNRCLPMCLRANIVHFQITVHLFLSFYPAF